jgi:hypothetical protein
MVFTSLKQRGLGPDFRFAFPDQQQNVAIVVRLPKHASLPSDALLFETVFLPLLLPDHSYLLPFVVVRAPKTQ